MSETELPQGKTKFVVGQKIDSIELRATKMAAKGEVQSTGIRIQAKPPYPLRRKKQILTNYSDKGIADYVLDQTHMSGSRSCSEATGMVRGRGVEPLRPFGH
jgi:hypothetical protein